ncbi:MAG: hypothetical protein QXJ17_02305 [Nitrososphaeria archaeon]
MSYKLSLKLDVNKNLFIESESIKVCLTIYNADIQTIRLEDLTISNNPVFFKIVNRSGQEFTCSLQSLRDRDGVGEKPPLEKTWVELKPGASKTINVDLMSLLPKLPINVYEVMAYYRTSPLSFLLSNKVMFEVLKMNCIYAKTTMDYTWYDNTPFYTVWVNEDKEGRQLFSMVNSANAPQNVISNNRVTKVAEFKEILCSLPLTLEQERRHIIWTEGHMINVGVIKNGELTSVEALSGEYGVPLSPSITTEYGELKFLTLLKRGNDFHFFFVRVLPSDEVDVKEVFKGTGSIGQYSIIFDKNRLPHVAFTLDNTIFYLRIGGLFNKGFELREIFKANDSKIFVKLMERFSVVDRGYKVILNYTLKEGDKMVSNSFDLVDFKHLSNYYIPLEIEDLCILQMVLDDINSPYFLLVDEDGNLWFKGAKDGIERATLEGERYPSNIVAPTLLLSSRYNVNYGVYLRYVKDGDFVYRKLKTLRV